MKLKITVHGVAYEVEVEVLDAGDGFPPPSAAVRPRPKQSNTPAGGPAPAAKKAPSGGSSGEGGVASPIAGTILEIKCKAGDSVTQGQVLLVIEAMKMKTSIAAPAAGTVKRVPVAVGDSVRENQMLVEFE